MDALGQIIAGVNAGPVDALTREKLAEFHGRDPHPTGAGQPHVKIKQPNFPQFHFEWHPGTRKVYLARLGTVDAEGKFVPAVNRRVIAEILAEHAETHAHAYNFVQTFLRGYREGQTPNISKPHLEG